MKKHTLSIFKLAVITFSLTSFSLANQNDLSVLVVRGGHAYDTPEFEEMCQRLEGVSVDLVLTPHMERMKAADIDQKYDAILFLNQNKFYPISPKNRKQYMDLAQLGLGMVFLQFTLSSQPEWDEYHDLVGGKWFLKNYTEDPKLHSTYFTDLTVDIKILDTEHPVTQDLDDFTMTDAFYGNIHIDPNVHPLLGSNNPELAPILAWAHTYKQSKVVYINPGFTKEAYENESYQKLIKNSLKFVAE
ncbi:MAG: ThuA domain-containing protein [Opitutales bacterium]|jgi:uncharacterized protein|nr:ThuA domain-containing protein [Opitutales bacterium]MDB2499545.1 ThuA domain-containing protein [bacterium]MDG2168504.1 ThuA domain-containing protein [Opitutales bacterium]